MPVASRRVSSEHATNVQGLLGGSLNMILGVGSGIGRQLSETLQCHCRGAHEPSCDGFVSHRYCYSNDLAGQVIGITRYNSSTHAVAAVVSRKLGLETAATLRPIGDRPGMQAAFEQKASL